MRAERRDVYEPIVDDPWYARVIENTRSAAQAGLSIAEQIKRKARSRREIFQTGFDAILGNAWIAGEVHSCRSVGKLCGMDASHQTAEPKLLHAPLDFPPRKGRLIA